MFLCEYGCGKEAIFQLKNGKWCCSKYITQCEIIKKKNKKSNIGKIITEETINKIRTSNLGKKRSKNTRQKISISKTGATLSKETKIKIGLKSKNNTANTGRFFSSTWKKNISLGMQKIWKDQNSIFNSIGYREKLKQYMINGGAIKALKGMKNISKEELKLRKMIKKLYPYCEFQHPVLNYSLDIALLDQKIAIEYDGYFHFCNEEKIEYHKLRQEKIEKEGWKFLRYTMFDKFPDKEQIKNDIQRILNETN